MIKIIWLFLSFYLLMLALNCCTNSSRTIYYRFPDGKIKTKIEFKSAENENYDITNFYENGKIAQKASVIRNKYIGTKLIYCESGRIYQIDSIENACDTSIYNCDGKLIRFYENGKISQRFTVKNGMFNGICEQYDTNGLIVKRYELIDDTTKMGEYKEFYINGVTSMRTNYKNNVIEGLTYFFNERGDTIKYYYSDSGKIKLPYKTWKEDRSSLLLNFSNTNKDTVIYHWFNEKGIEIKSKKIRVEGNIILRRN